MSLTASDFDAFFAALHDGHRPFAWQRRLLLDVLDGARWPDAIVAPTGSGKTAAIDVHVFALAVAAATGAPLPPRRLAMVVDRRVLVDDQYRHAREVARRLADPGGCEILARVAQQLWSLQPTVIPGASPLLVARLRGGSPPSRRWADHPSAAAVLCATPDMWGSRLLFRGYGSSRLAWAREAGLLATDTVAIVDEAHLARQLLHAARRVGELVAVIETKHQGPTPIQVVETTATPATAGGRRLGVESDDLDVDSALRARLCRPKPVTLIPRKDWATVRPRPAVVDELVRQAAQLRERTGQTVGCFVNTVARAVAVSNALRDERIVGRALTVVMLCGQVRPIDIDRLETRYPGLLSTKGHPDIDVLVSTQTLEVGVDLDLGGLVTELASGSAIAQRAGRVNRLGTRAEGPIVVVVPDGTIRADTRSGPYAADDLTAAATWLAARAADPAGLAPWAVRGDAPPPAATRRRLLQRPELGQVWHWARTSDDLATDPQLDLWLSDDLDSDMSVGLVVRDALPPDDEAVELINLLPPRRHEVFGVPMGTAREALADALAAVRKPDRDAQLRAVLVRGGDVGPLDWVDRGEETVPRLRPGDIVVLDSATKLFTAAAGGGGPWTPPVVVPHGDEIHRHAADDVLESTAEQPGGPRDGDVVLRIELADEHPLRQLLTETDGPDPLDERTIVTDWLHDHGTAAMARAAAELLRTSDRLADVVVQRDAEGQPLRAVVLDGRRAMADEYVRQERTLSSRPVRLDRHQKAVAERVADLSERVGLGQELCDVLRLAALHHDDGKADPRFQVKLGARGEVPLAKSHDRATPETVRRRADRSGLPPRWRHEQRSVVDAWPSLLREVDPELATLVARLIGTTHGHGRVWFPHTSAELLGDRDDDAARKIAASLFDEGGWDELIERTDRRYGVWGCAYLEALLRAADGQVSAEKR